MAVLAGAKVHGAPAPYLDEVGISGSEQVFSAHGTFAPCLDKFGTCSKDIGPMAFCIAHRFPPPCLEQLHGSCGKLSKDDPTNVNVSIVSKTVMLRELTLVEWRTSEPKRPQAAFYLFMQEQRAIQEEPIDSEWFSKWMQMWQSLNMHEKLHYVAIAARFQAEYEEQVVEFSREPHYRVRAIVEMSSK